MSIHWYWGFRSRYSFVRSACVTPSRQSTIGHAKSYVGYTLNLSLVATRCQLSLYSAFSGSHTHPVRWWGSGFPR